MATPTISKLRKDPKEMQRIIEETSKSTAAELGYEFTSEHYDDSFSGPRVSGPRGLRSSAHYINFQKGPGDYKLAYSKKLSVIAHGIFFELDRTEVKGTLPHAVEGYGRNGKMLATMVSSRYRVDDLEDNFNFPMFSRTKSGNVYSISLRYLEDDADSESVLIDSIRAVAFSLDDLEETLDAYREHNKEQLRKLKEQLRKFIPEKQEL